MIGLIGIKKNTPLEIREKFIIKPNKHNEYFEKFLKEVREIVLLATCNRTEIYFNASLQEEALLKKIFDIFNWDYTYKDYIFITSGKDVYRHLFEVCAGFHSKILGEDQILGQVKQSYEEAIELKAVSIELHRLFQEAITCGKKFRKEAKLFEIPVSSASIVINEAIKKNCSTFMVLGHGKVGQLVMKYLLSHNIEKVYLVVRKNNIEDYIDDKRVEIIGFEEKNEYINNVNCIISCTSAPHTIILKNDIREEGDKLYIYDLAVPRDVEKDISLFSRVEVYNIDAISRIDDHNKKLRKEKMEENKYIMNKYLEEYDEWIKLRKISPVIKDLKNVGSQVIEKRIKTFTNKSKDDRDIGLAEKLIKSTSDFYINRVIEVIKEETLKGSEKECLRIIQKIFSEKN